MESESERLTGLKMELEAIKRMKYLSFDVMDEAVKWYRHEIWRLEEHDDDGR